MPFDLSTAKPASGGFDISSAKPIEDTQAPKPAGIGQPETQTIAPSAALIGMGAGGMHAPQPQRAIAEDLSGQESGIGELITGSGRATPITEELPEIQESGILSTAPTSTVARLSPALLTATNPDEIVSIIQSNVPEVAVTYDKDAQGNIFPILTNRETGARAQVNRPGISALDVLQGLGIGAALTPAGRLGAGLGVGGRAAAIGGGSAGIASGLEATQAAQGGEVNIEDIALEGVGAGAFSVVGDLASSAIKAAKQSKSAKDAVRDADKLIEEAAPSVDTLKQASREIFEDLKSRGSNISPKTFERLSGRVAESASNLGLKGTAAGRNLNPQSSNVIELLSDLADGDISVFDLEDVRIAAKNAAGVADRAGNNRDKAIALSIADNIDDAVSKLKPQEIVGGGEEAGKQFNVARELWGRARRSEMIQEAFEDASTQASGFENGIRIAFRKILKNKKKRGFFKKEELDAMRKVEQGTKGANLARLLGGFAFGDDKVRNILGGASGVGLGGFAGGTIAGGAGGAIGALVLPTVGTVSRKLATRLTKGNADFADQVIRAGVDAKKIALAYIKNTPKEFRDPEELAQLLMRKDLKLPENINIPILKEAIDFRDAALVGAGAGPVISEEQ